MKSLITAFALIAVLFGLSAASFAAAADEVAAPTFAVGDSWELRNAYGAYTTTVVEVAGDGVVLTRSYEPNVRLVYDKDLVIRRIEGTPRSDPKNFIGWQFISFPAAPGKSFSYRVEWVRGIFFSIKVRAVKWEEITVPAGTFRALRLESCWRNETSGWYDCGMTHWYAPEAKTFIKRTTPSSWADAVRRLDFELERLSLAR